jgi:hypothetical protein
MVAGTELVHEEFNWSCTDEHATTQGRGGMRRMGRNCNEEFYNSYCSQNSIRIMKLSRWAEYAARTGDTRSVQRLRPENLRKTERFVKR